MVKNKKIIFRVDDRIYDFINWFCQKNNLDKSEHMRQITNYWFMAFLSGQMLWKKDDSYKEMREKFIETLSEKDLKTKL